MKTLAESLSMKMGFTDGAYNIPSVNKDINWYDTLCLICAELNINLKDIDDNDFDSTSFMLSDFAGSANESTGYSMSVWFD